jgi:hypothetical protein
MKFNLTDIETEEDRQRALAVLVALAPVMRPDTADTPVVESVKKPRRRKANGVDEPEQVAESESVEPAPVEPVAASAVEPVPATAPDDEAAREELRQVARTKGVVWLREILANYQAARLGDLTLEQVQETLRAAA